MRKTNLKFKSDHVLTDGRSCCLTDMSVVLADGRAFLKFSTQFQCLQLACVYLEKKIHCLLNREESWREIKEIFIGFLILIEKLVLEKSRRGRLVFYSEYHPKPVTWHLSNHHLINPCATALGQTRVLGRGKQVC